MKEVRRGVYHPQHVNAYHSCSKKWIRGSDGVSTKYLHHYLLVQTV